MGDMDNKQTNSMSARQVHDRYLRASSVGRVAPPPSRRRWLGEDHKRIVYVALLLSLTTVGLAQQRHTRSVEPAAYTVETVRDGLHKTLPQLPNIEEIEISRAPLEVIATPVARRRVIEQPVASQNSLDEADAAQDYLVIVYSTDEERKAVDYVREHLAEEGALQVIQSNTGYYGVTLGAFSAEQAVRARQKAIRKELAADAYLMHRNRVVRWVSNLPVGVVSEPAVGRGKGEV
ncbi:MAG: hypothetical protein ACR2PZ_11770 [Pseudomonadales bacterium]